MDWAELKIIGIKIDILGIKIFIYIKLYFFLKIFEDIVIFFNCQHVMLVTEKSIYKMFKLRGL